jgi:hypothetical protein
MKPTQARLGSVDKSKIVLLAFIILFSVLLSIFGMKGTYSRYAQDDYCYGYRFRAAGFWEAQVTSYYQKTEYNSDRYTLTMVNGLSELIGGPDFAPYLPTITIITWAGIFTYLVFLILKPFRNIILSVLVALIIVFFTFFLSPNQYQNLFWTAAIHTYTTPVVLTTLILARIIHFTLAKKFTWLNGIEISVLCIFTGGFSEATTIWQFTIWLCGLFVLFFFKRDTLFRDARKPLVIAVFSTLFALAIMMMNPTNSIRASTYTHLGLFQIITQSLFFAEEFIRVSIKAAPLPFAIVFLLGLWLCWNFAPKRTENWKNSLGKLIIAIVVVYALCFTTMATYLYAAGVYPGDRAQLAIHFALICGLFLIGWILAGFISNLATKGTWPKSTSILIQLLGVLLFAYLIRAIPRVYDKYPLYQARAQAWDARQQLIMDEKSKGFTEITVPQFDSIYGITELKNDPNNWVNQCAAKYYGVQSITAVDGYLDTPAYPIGK